MFEVVANIRLRNRWALIAIALLISVSVSLMQYFFSVQKNDANIINIAGKQRMLSQKIAWHGDKLLTSQVPSTSHQQSLDASLSLFKANHQYLLLKNDNGQYKYLSPELIKLYIQSPIELDLRVQKFIQQVEGLLYKQEKINPNVFSVKRMEELLKYLDQAVGLFEKASVKKVAWVSSAELFFWLLTMLLLIGVLRFVFIPMEKQITKALSKYQQQKDFAQQVSKNKEHFIARASHEFRTPLQGFVTSIDSLEVSNSQKSIKTQASYCASRIIAMLDELQDLQALSLGRWALKPSNENLLQSFNKVLLGYEFGYNQKGIALVRALDSTLDQAIKLDHQRFQQVLAELVGNALKFTEEGAVTVKACVSNKQLTVTITDTGSGLTKPVSRLTFDSSNQDNHFQGLRTGLARVQYIVDAFDGNIVFENTSPNGVCVTLKMPVVIDESAPSLSALLPKNMHCLVVEDNPLNMHILTRILSQLNYSYECAKNGKVACEMATKNEYQVIFMDLNMPIMDGFEAIKKIRIFDANTPIIVVTANTSTEDMKLVYEYGASGHIHKPIGKQAIVDALVNVCMSSEIN